LKEGSSERGAGGGSVREALAAASFPRLWSGGARGRRRAGIRTLGWRTEMRKELGCPGKQHV